MKNLGKIKILLALGALFGYNSASAQDDLKQSVVDQSAISFPTKEQYLGSKLTFQVFQAENKTWAYDIFSNNQLFIHQTTIPGLPGNKGFKTRDAATAVAKLVIEKIAGGQMPPSVTIDEMQKIGAL
jgi:hypothetical protein